jgi:hypothetical protein
MSTGQRSEKQGQKPDMADVVENFKNAVLTEAVMNRGPDIDLVDAFANSGMFHLERYLVEPGVDASTAQTLRDIAARAIDRARTAGRVEAFEPE